MVVASCGEVAREICDIHPAGSLAAARVADSTVPAATDFPDAAAVEISAAGKSMQLGCDVVGTFDWHLDHDDIAHLLVPPEVRFTCYCWEYVARPWNGVTMIVHTSIATPPAFAVIQTTCDT